MKPPPISARFFSALVTATLLGFLVAASGQSYAQQALEYSAHYKASANGIAASADRSLSRLADNSYQITNLLRASLLGVTIAKLEQRSEFDFSGGRIQPSSYSYLLSGISKASNTIAFNWDTQTALSTEDEDSWQLELSDGIMDELSYQFALRQLLISGSTAQEMEFSLIDGDEVELHQYRVLADEVLPTPLGNLNTIKLGRVREASDERVTTIWLARDWNFLLTRIEQVSGSGLRIELELENATIAGEAVSALK